MNYIIIKLMARDSNKFEDSPHQDRIKILVGEVFVGVKCTGGSKGSDWREIMSTLILQKIMTH